MQDPSVVVTVEELPVNVVIASIGAQGPAGTTQWPAHLTLPFAARDTGRTWLRMDGASTYEAPLPIHADTALVGVSWAMSEADNANAFELLIYDDTDVLLHTVNITAGQQKSRAEFDVSLTQGSCIKAALAFATGTGRSAFCSGRFTLQFRG